MLPDWSLMAMAKDTAGGEGRSGWVNATMHIDDGPCTHNETLARARHTAAFLT